MADLRAFDPEVYLRFGLLVLFFVAIVAGAAVGIVDRITDAYVETHRECP